MKSFTDISVDLETYGKEPGCVILEVAFVAFDRYNKHRTPRPFNVFPSIEEQLDLGFKIDHDTLIWWTRGNPEAFQRQLNAERVSIEEAAHELNWFVANHCNSESLLVWAKGSHFDFPILQTILKAPWHFRNVHDLRTLAFALPHVGRLERGANYRSHYALDDAMFQAMEIQNLCSMIVTGE